MSHRAWRVISVSGNIYGLGKDIMKTLITIIAGFVVVNGAAIAQQESAISNPNGMVRSFDIATLTPILTELGLEVETYQTPNGKTIIAATYTPTNFALNFIPTACQNNNVSNCLGLSTLAMYTVENVNAQTLMAFNEHYHFASTGKFSDGSGVFILRYEIADFGIPRGNIAASIGNFLVLAGKFEKELSDSSPTANQIGYADDMSAKLLNGRGLEAVTGKPQEVSSRLEAHQTSFEEIPELVKLMMTDDNAVRNKISNINPE